LRHPPRRTDHCIADQMNIQRNVLTRICLGVSGLAPALMTAVSVILCPIVALSEDSSPNVVIQWNNAALQGVRDSKIGPPMVARALAIVHTCIYDAWSAYDHKAVGTQLGSSLRQHPSKRKRANQNKAISFAAYRAAVDLFPVDKAAVFDPLMAKLDWIVVPVAVGSNPTTHPKQTLR